MTDTSSNPPPKQQCPGCVPAPDERCGAGGATVRGRPVGVCCLDAGHTGTHKTYDPTVGIVEWEAA